MLLVIITQQQTTVEQQRHNGATATGKVSEQSMKMLVVALAAGAAGVKLLQ